MTIASAARSKSSAARKGKEKPRRSSLSTRGVSALLARITKLESLLDITKAMTAERDLDSLLRLILSEAVRVVDADRCSLWIVDQQQQVLWTKVAQGIRDGSTIRIPLGVGIAGQVAATGEVINIRDAYADARFNRAVDKDTGYRTQTILGVPMRYTTGETTGVLQALNKRDGHPFTTEDEELLMAFGANAAAAIENAILYEEIDRLFEGFVKAAVVAIESRDPTTSGHSERVARLTLGIAENVAKAKKEPYASLRFDATDLRELRYAALLHDFGKVGVREDVLTKAEKLYPGELAAIKARFNALAAQRENACLRQALRDQQEGRFSPEKLDAELQQERERIRQLLALVQRCNQPTVLDATDGAKLEEVAALRYLDEHGACVPLLESYELERLAIPRGSLDGEERRELESHVVHSYQFLSQIPWTRALRRVPEIAHAHHEKLNGKGYPLRLVADQIPLQSRMISVADIYDALTASDRPYKHAVPHEKALDILSEEARAGSIDSVLLGVFIDAQVFRCVR